MMITAPTIVMVTVWPIPHRLPMRAAPHAVFWRVTIVATAMTWSGSVACRIPSSNPSTMIGRLVMVVATFPGPAG